MKTTLLVIGGRRIASIDSISYSRLHLRRYLGGKALWCLLILRRRWRVGTGRWFLAGIGSGRFTRISFGIGLRLAWVGVRWQRVHLVGARVEALEDGDEAGCGDVAVGVDAGDGVVGDVGV